MCRRLFNPVLTQSTRAARLEIQRIGILQKETRGNGGARTAQLGARASVTPPNDPSHGPPQGYAPVATAEYEPDSSPPFRRCLWPSRRSRGSSRAAASAARPPCARPPPGVHKGAPLARFDARILRLGRFARFPRETACDARSHHPRVATGAASSAANLPDELARLKKAKLKPNFHEPPFPFPTAGWKILAIILLVLLPRWSTPARPHATRATAACINPASPLGPPPTRQTRSPPGPPPPPPPTRPQAPVSRSAWRRSPRSRLMRHEDARHQARVRGWKNHQGPGSPSSKFSSRSAQRSLRTCSRRPAPRA